MVEVSFMLEIGVLFEFKVIFSLNANRKSFRLSKNSFITSALLIFNILNWYLLILDLSSLYSRCHEFLSIRSRLCLYLASRGDNSRRRRKKTSCRTMQVVLYLWLWRGHWGKWVVHLQRPLQGKNSCYTQTIR